MPINSFYGRWKYSTNISNTKEWQQSLPLFQQYLEKQGLKTIINITAFAEALNKGLYFDANIPTGYGLGSSGALCAAILDTFGVNKEHLTLLELKHIFAQMESFFHGASSGTDPLVSYLNYPILLGTTIKKVTITKEKNKGDLFLLDTNVQRKASPFINGFLDRCKETFYDKRCSTQLVPLVDDAIHTFLNNQWELLFDTMHELSLFQYRYFDFMILDPFKQVWLEGLSSNHFKLKICGAGGGGFLLGISNDRKKTAAVLKKQKLIWL